ncbi:hypothetical protein AMECASPLE_022168 [Ameca splendens]|uniref:Uncharacterized protein n=1 Tax=Ameca splendens TaxID=208324 RepID=A0ABV0YFC5_9TELE
MLAKSSVSLTPVSKPNVTLGEILYGTMLHWRFAYAYKRYRICQATELCAGLSCCVSVSPFLHQGATGRCCRTAATHRAITEELLKQLSGDQTKKLCSVFAFVLTCLC